MIYLNAQIQNELSQLPEKQIPYAVMTALNSTAIGARDAVRQNLPSNFKLRNKWTLGGIQAKLSNKSTLMAMVTAPGYMQIQETGGTRMPGQSKLLAAPSNNLQGNRVIPKGKRPKALMDSGKAFVVDMGQGDAAIFARSGKGKKKVKLMYWLSSDQGYEKRFGFEEDVTQHVEDRFAHNFSSVMALALR